MEKEKKPKECKEFIQAVKAIRRRKHVRLSRNYRKDPREYDIPQLMPTPSCENCKSIFKEDREVTLYGYTRIDTKCKQNNVCPKWTLYPEEIEGSTQDENV